MIQKVIFALFLTLSFTFAGEGMEYAKKGIECKDRGDRGCTITNLERALDTGELNQKQVRAIKMFLRTTYHESVEKNLEQWSINKIERYAKRGIELSDTLSLSGDWYDVSFYLWRAIAYGDDGDKRQAKILVQKVEKLMSMGRYKEGMGSVEQDAFKQWANKIIRAVRRL
ncbi:hypothetical protein GSY74_03445 [Sulfurovum sp. bin170]|uniref:hypothetical protein n=1 Tax=Sulfurovum sp. bin170 TaxID=2695268 RepID=UPI0013E09C96|nr:hypothetical protein [Sulfurovum sp. bin170]NEW60328.1 hypothetical protein [Sulfurovum sp. bin170]